MNLYTRRFSPNRILTAARSIWDNLHMIYNGVFSWRTVARIEEGTILGINMIIRYLFFKTGKQIKGNWKSLALLVRVISFNRRTENFTWSWSFVRDFCFRTWPNMNPSNSCIRLVKDRHEYHARLRKHILHILTKQATLEGSSNKVVLALESLPAYLKLLDDGLSKKTKLRSLYCNSGLCFTFSNTLLFNIIMIFAQPNFRSGAGVVHEYSRGWSCTLAQS